jgi:hypothetical protein
MDAAARDAVRQAMRNLLHRPINYLFFHLNELEVPTYTSRVPHPIDLERIEVRLDRGGYSTAREWYDDVCLCYQNALRFHDEDSAYHHAAAFHLRDFQKTAGRLQCIDPVSWGACVKNQFEKIVEIAGNGPVPQGLDPVLKTFAKAIDGMVPVTPKEIVETIEWLNTQTEKPDVNRDILFLLAKYQPELDVRTKDALVVDAERLNAQARRALFLYARTHAERRAAGTLQ